MREITRDPLRHFVLPALKASGNLPPFASARRQRRGSESDGGGGADIISPPVHFVSREDTQAD